MRLPFSWGRTYGVASALTGALNRPNGSASLDEVFDPDPQHHGLAGPRRRPVSKRRRLGTTAARSAGQDVQAQVEGGG
jgi:hypothetical protein